MSNANGSAKPVFLSRARTAFSTPSASDCQSRRVLGHGLSPRPVRTKARSTPGLRTLRASSIAAVCCSPKVGFPANSTNAMRRGSWFALLTDTTSPGSSLSATDMSFSVRRVGEPERSVAVISTITRRVDVPAADPVVAAGGGETAESLLLFAWANREEDKQTQYTAGQRMYFTTSPCFREEMQPPPTIFSPNHKAVFQLSFRGPKSVEAPI